MNGTTEQDDAIRSRITVAVHSLNAAVYEATEAGYKIEAGIEYSPAARSFPVMPPILEAPQIVVSIGRRVAERII